MFGRNFSSQTLFATARHTVLPDTWEGVPTATRCTSDRVLAVARALWQETELQREWKPFRCARFLLHTKRSTV